jgi:hypothetical protein
MNRTFRAVLSDVLSSVALAKEEALAKSEVPRTRDEGGFSNTGSEIDVPIGAESRLYNPATPGCSVSVAIGKIVALLLHGPIRFEDPAENGFPLFRELSDDHQFYLKANSVAEQSVCEYDAGRFGVGAQTEKKQANSTQNRASVTMNSEHFGPAFDASRRRAVKRERARSRTGC